MSADAPAAAGGRHGLRAIGLVVGGTGLDLGDALELAGAAEDAGLELLGAGDGFVENLAVMGALATRTRSAELFSAVMGWTRTPVTMALAALTMQDLSRGRYRLGFGTMPRQWSEDWHDVEAARPVARMRDFVAAVRAACSSERGEPRSYDGEFYRFTGYERQSPTRPQPPPIYLAATRPRMAELAAEIADGVIFNLINSPEWIAQACWSGIETGLARAGRTREQFDAGIMLYCAIDDDRRRAFDMIRPALAFYFAVPYFAPMLEHHGMTAELRAGREAAARGDRAGMAAAVSDEMVRTFALAGTADEVREQISRYGALLDWALLAAPLLNTRADTRELVTRIIATFAPGGVMSAARIVEARASAWSEHPGVPGGRIKVLGEDAGGNPTVTLNWLPPVLAAHPPERHYHRSVVEHGYVLAGELAIREYDDRDDEQGELVVFRPGYFFRRLPGSVHGVDSAPRAPGIGFLILEWRSGPGTYLWEEGAERETTSLALPGGDSQPPGEATPSAVGVVRDRGGVRIIDTRAAEWGVDPALRGGFATVLWRAGDGTPMAALRWLAHDGGTGEAVRGDADAGEAGAGGAYTGTDSGTPGAGGADIGELGYVLAGRLSLPGCDRDLDADCFYERGAGAGLGAPRAAGAPGCMLLTWRAG